MTSACGSSAPVMRRVCASASSTSATGAVGCRMVGTWVSSKSCTFAAIALSAAACCNRRCAARRSPAIACRAPAGRTRARAMRTASSRRPASAQANRLTRQRRLVAHRLGHVFPAALRCPGGEAWREVPAGLRHVVADQPRSMVWGGAVDALGRAPHKGHQVGTCSGGMKRPPGCLPSRNFAVAVSRSGRSRPSASATSPRCPASTPGRHRVAGDAGTRRLGRDRARHAGDWPWWSVVDAPGRLRQHTPRSC